MALSVEQMMRVVGAWNAARATFLQGVGWELGFGGVSGTWTIEEAPEPLRPYIQIFDAAGAQVVAALSGVATPMAVLQAISDGAQSAAHEAYEKAKRGAYESGMAAAGFPIEAPTNA